MMYWDTNTAIGRLMEAGLNERGWSVNDLAHALGYRNLNKGRRRLAALTAGVTQDPELLRAISGHLHLPVDAVEKAMQATLLEAAEIKKRRAQWRFRPQLSAVTEGDGGQMPLVVRAVAWQSLCAVPLPAGFHTWGFERQMPAVQRAAIGHYGSHGGIAAPFGPITGYRFRRTFTQTLLLDPNGKVREFLADEVTPEAPRIYVKGREVPLPALGGESTPQH